MNMSKTRIMKLQQKLKAAAIDGVVYATSANFVYLLDLEDFYFQRYGCTILPDDPRGIPTLTRPDCMLYVPADGEPVVFCIPRRKKDLEGIDYPVVVAYEDYFKNRLFEFVSGSRIAVGRSCENELKEIVKDAFDCHGGSDKVEIVDGENLTADLRRIKDEKEIQTLREAAAFTDYAMGEIVKILQPGICPFDVEKKIAQIGMDAGLHDLAFIGMCGFVEKGHPTSYSPYIFPKNRPMQKNTGISFDFGYVWKNYSSDYGRSFYVGDATEHCRESYKALQFAQQELVKSIVPGVTKVSEVSDILYNALEKKGRGHQLRHHDVGGQGHQIGIDVHEFPWIRRDSEGVFEPGMVFCSEPKIFIPDEAYMRVEDMILITETGAEFLTKFDRDLYVL